jgi:signal transduction histidine kinase
MKKAAYPEDDGRRDSNKLQDKSSPAGRAKTPATSVQAAGEQVVLEAIDAEQQRLAQSLHDTVCQSLTGMNILASLIARKLKTLSPEIAREVIELRDLIGQTSEEVHDMVRWLRPPALAGGGLLFALQELAAETSRRIPCSFSASDNPISVDGYISAQLFHIVQTGVQDSLGRPGATKIAVSVEIDERKIEISVEDDAGKVSGANKPPAKDHARVENRRAAGGSHRCHDLHERHGKGHLVKCEVPHTATA